MKFHFFFHIQLLGIHGRKRINGVTIAKVDSNWQLIPGTETFMSCDTLLLSVGLIPENELARTIGLQMDEVTSGAITDQNRETSIKRNFCLWKCTPCA